LFSLSIFAKKKPGRVADAAPLAQSRGFRIFNRSVDDCRGPGITGAMDNRIDMIFAALADPTRRAILVLLLEDDMAVTDVAEPFAMSLAAISKHLSILTRAGLISQEKRGRVKWCKLEPEAMRDVSVWMQGFGQFDRLDLDAFERFLEAELPAADAALDLS
jgi:DNA-binding transcriptional ArsR family regulator